MNQFFIPVPNSLHARQSTSTAEVQHKRWETRCSPVPRFRHVFITFFSARHHDYSFVTFPSLISSSHESWKCIFHVRIFSKVFSCGKVAISCQRVIPWKWRWDFLESKARLFSLFKLSLQNGRFTFNYTFHWLELSMIELCPFAVANLICNIEFDEHSSILFF